MSPQMIEITEEERDELFYQDLPCPVSPHERCYAYQGKTRCDDCPLIVVTKGREELE